MSISKEEEQEEEEVTKSSGVESSGEEQRMNPQSTSFTFSLRFCERICRCRGGSVCFPVPMVMR